MIKKMFSLIFALVLSSCTSVKYSINSSKYKSNSYNERVRFVVLHYTALNDERSITALTKNRVSSHYLVTQGKYDPVYSLVNDTKRAWHAGKSSFDGYINLNDNSIGIEISNLGYSSANKQKTSKLREGIVDTTMFYPYNNAQIFKIGMLLKELTVKYNINPKYIVGHSDIAPTRKFDPGPKFPWKYLHDKYGVGAWYDKKDFNTYYSEALFKSYSVVDLKKELRNYGYDINSSDTWDLESKKVVSAFQMHFRPRRIDGVFDLETFAIVKALNKKYK
ncbi:N-acetylmuramoyl-L-alanine amidase [Candidatus Cetobacterium colombiensis]|uniref:N-acetylmuramoyl-L-alanine amidase n=1 Tax=Candidatus Cetobacterium colombiensis TaxID=3073100 RepID=A0ABU4W8L8_9FUSO|nr:N-acetylmuramoyl-L-alanine amidase [Candidatus Cetobacterium colombiensis]MDX8335392.1 N-acetylmuramoyl-L-alanine amidase [Candidatus Cetobacterium colombiensis]